MFKYIKRSKRLLEGEYDERDTNNNSERADESRQQGFKWRGHTHPGYTTLELTPSDGDYNVLKAFEQNKSCIYNSLGEHELMSLINAKGETP